MGYVDDGLKRIFDFLESSGMLNNTIVVLYSNHGDSLYDNGLLGHGISYQSNVHVPVLIRHPKVHEKIEIETPVSLIDLMPTLYSMLNVSPINKISGISLLPLLGGETYKRYYLFGINSGDRYVRHKNMKLIIEEDNSKRLFNITADPYESNDVSEQNPEILRELEAELQNHEIEQLGLVR
jgi:arylsulfatase A-like enzyme